MKKNYCKINGKKLSRKQQKQVMIFVLAKLGFQKLDPAKKVFKARKIVDAMTGNPNFTMPIPSLAAVSAAALALNNAQQALDGTEIKTHDRNVAEAVLDKLMSQLQGYVDAVSGKDGAKVLSAGFELRSPATKAVILDAPAYLQADMTRTEGEIKLKFQPVKKKLFYQVETAIESTSPLVWEPAATASKATIFIKDLEPGQKYHVRVRTVNSAGISEPSEEVVCRTYQY